MNVKISLKRAVRSTVKKLRQNSFYIGTRHNTLSPIRYFRLTSLGLFGSHELQKIPQLQASFVELRLTVANRAAHHLGNFVMLEPFDIVQHKNRSITRRQAVNRSEE